MPKMLDDIRMMLSGEISPPPIATLLGFTLTSVEPGEAVIAFEAATRLCDIADAAMGMAYASTLAEGETFTTLELKINFLKPVWTGRLRAIGRVVKAGQTVVLLECDITDEGKNLVARASSTCMTLRGQQAEGR
jgi:acyl-coenzyme A thioesterase PaaI-like protein